MHINIFAFSEVTLDCELLINAELLGVDHVFHHCKSQDLVMNLATICLSALLQFSPHVV